MTDTPKLTLEEYNCIKQALRLRFKHLLRQVGTTKKIERDTQLVLPQSFVIKNVAEMVLITSTLEKIDRGGIQI